MICLEKYDGIVSFTLIPSQMHRSPISSENVLSPHNSNSNMARAKLLFG